MKNKSTSGRFFHSVKIMACVGIATAILLAGAFPAEAHGRKHGRDRRHDRHGHRLEKRIEVHAPHLRLLRHRHVRITPPRVIMRHEATTYRPYYWGRIYDARHGHYHVVYRFPVRTRAGIVYRAHAYCNGHHHASGSFTIHGPVFDLHIRH